MTKMVILITGHKGYIGSTLVQYLKKKINNLFIIGLDTNFFDYPNSKLIDLEIKDDLRNFSTIILKSYCDQYIEILIKSNIKKSNIDKIILSGGIPKKIPLIRDYLEYKSGITSKIDNSKVDETLIGLIRLMKFNL